MLTITESNAVDNVKMLQPVLAEDKRARHKEEVILRALEISEQKFGSFQFESVNTDMTPSRSISSLKTGELINVFIAPANKTWESATIPIRVPIRFGLLSYRLLLIDKKNLHKFEKVKSLSDLKALWAGLQKDWVTADIFKASNINAVLGSNFEGIFLMLKKNRFDYIPRAIYEIYDELQNRERTLEDIIIEPKLALYIPTATFVYVSSATPRIAKRLEYGLKALASNGELKRIFNKYYEEDIAFANLAGRRVIQIRNPYYEGIAPDTDLWIKPY